MKSTLETARVPSVSRFASHRPVAAFVGLLVLVQIGWSAPAWAQAGALDLTFGSNGKVITDFAKKADDAASVAVLQPNGSTVVAGWATVSGVRRFALARYNFDGSLDTTFGTGGKVTTSFNGVDDAANSVALQADGKILVAGTTNTGNQATNFAIARYNTNGSLDTSFDFDGKVTTQIDFGTYNSASAVAVDQTTGKIVVAGFSGNSFVALTELRFAVVRYNTNGSLDTTFGGGDGMVTTDFGGLFSSATSVAVQTDSKIVAAGWSDAGSTDSQDFAVARYNSDGTLDHTFGENLDGQ